MLRIRESGFQSVATLRHQPILKSILKWKKSRGWGTAGLGRLADLLSRSLPSLEIPARATDPPNEFGIISIQADSVMAGRWRSPTNGSRRLALGNLPHPDQAAIGLRRATPRSTAMNGATSGVAGFPANMRSGIPHDCAGAEVQVQNTCNRLRFVAGLNHRTLRFLRLQHGDYDGPCRRRLSMRELSQGGLPMTAPRRAGAAGSRQQPLFVSCRPPDMRPQPRSAPVARHDSILGGCSSTTPIPRSPSPS